MTAPHFVTASEGSRRLGVPVSLILRAVEAGRLPATRAGEFKNSPLLIPVEAIERLRLECPDILPHEKR